MLRRRRRNHPPRSSGSAAWSPPCAAPSKHSARYGRAQRRCARGSRHCLSDRHSSLRRCRGERWRSDGRWGQHRRAAGRHRCATRDLSAQGDYRQVKRRPDPAVTDLSPELETIAEALPNDCNLDVGLLMPLRCFKWVAPRQEPRSGHSRPLISRRREMSIDKPSSRPKPPEAGAEGPPLQGVVYRRRSAAEVRRPL